MKRTLQQLELMVLALPILGPSKRMTAITTMETKGQEEKPQFVCNPVMQDQHI
jgi:peptide deformylase